MKVGLEARISLTSVLSTGRGEEASRRPKKVFPAKIKAISNTDHI